MTPRMEFVPLSPSAPAKMPEATVLCLGNFDGVHLAHRTLLLDAMRLRESRYPNAACGVLCFHGLASDHLLPSPLPHLCTKEERLDAFREVGIDFAVLIDFPTVKDLTAQEFLSQVLVGKCHCIATVCGFNFRFGKGGLGTPALLSEHFGKDAFVLPAVECDGAPISSTRIRALLQSGDVALANELLCRPYGFSSPIEHGKRLGRTIGIPTINQAIPAELLLPRRGVYVTDCTVDGIRYRGVTNVGVHPTVDTSAPVNCETFLLDFSGEAYGKTVRVEFLQYLRDEHRFDSLEELRIQIQKDISVARAFTR